MIETLDNTHFFSLIEQQLAKGRSVEITLKGKSMIPTLRPGYRLRLSPLTQTPQRNDILLFRNIHDISNPFVLHRLVRIESDGTLCMRGDNAVSCEHIDPTEVIARLTAISNSDSEKYIEVDSRCFAFRSRFGLFCRDIRTLFRWTISSVGRRRLRPFYFLCLFALMWLPLNGVGVSLDNFVLGIRLDHLLHASVFIPCALYLIDFRRFSIPFLWTLSILIGICTESIQYLLPYRGFDINDMIANAIGVSLGWALLISCKKITFFKT